MLQSGLGKYLAPTSMGAGYAIAKILLLKMLEAPMASEREFMMQFLAGVLLGFALRPLAKMIYWQRFAGFVMISLILFVMGSPGKIVLHIVWGNPMYTAYWQNWWAETGAALFMAVLATVLLPPAKNQVGLGLLKRRLFAQINPLSIIKLAACSAAYVGLFLGLQAWLDETWISTGLLERTQEFLNLPPMPASAKILLLALYGMILTMLVWSVCIVFLRGIVEQVVVIGSLAFVLGEFAPAFANFQQLEPLLLVDQVFIGFCRQFIFVGLIIFFFRNTATMRNKA